LKVPGRIASLRRYVSAASTKRLPEFAEDRVSQGN
jgi:hypothetical protein